MGALGIHIPNEHIKWGAGWSLNRSFPSTVNHNWRDSIELKNVVIPRPVIKHGNGKSPHLYMSLTF